MPREDLTLIACVIDRSGSMGSILDDAVGGFNAFLREQKEDKSNECRMTLTMFNDTYEIKYNNVPIGEVEEFTNATYCPAGSTALLDSLGRTINEVGKELDALPEEEKPGKVIFVVLTDGQENASKEFQLDNVKELIKQQRETWKWEFVFLATDEEGIQGGMNLGITHCSAFCAQNTRAAYDAVSKDLMSYRKTGKTNLPQDIS